MIRVDSCKINISATALKEYRKECFIDILKADNGNIFKATGNLKKEFLPFGVKSISVDRDVNGGEPKNINMELSAKVMQENYYDMINKNNIDLLVEKLNVGLAIRFDKNKFIDESIVYRFDNTYNLKVKNDVSKYIGALFEYKSSSKYDLKKYDNSGITIIKDVRTAAYKERMIFYNKFDEIIKDKQLHKYLNVNQFDNILRCEVNLRGYEQIRKAIGLKRDEERIKGTRQDIKLIDCLNAAENPNYKILCNFTSDIQNELFEEWRDKKVNMKEIISVEGMKRIIKQLNYEPKLIRQFIREHTPKGKPSYWNKKFQDKLISMLSEIIEVKNISIYIDEVKSLLEAA